MEQIGIFDFYKNRKTALNLIPQCQMIVSIKIKSGWRWMAKEKTSKLVHPNNIENNILEGWEFSK